MDLQEIRSVIDKIDAQLIQLFKERMDLSKKVAEYKKQHGIPIHDPVREREILIKVSEKVENEYEEAVKELYTLLLRLSKAEQEKM